MIPIHTEIIEGVPARRTGVWAGIRTGMLWMCALLLTMRCLTESAQCAQAVRDALTFCATVLLPSLFPFLVIGKYLICRGLADSFCAAFGKYICAPFRLSPPCAAAIVCGVLCGFPMGAAMTAQLYEAGAISREEAERTAGFCTLCGPAFLFGCVTAVTGNPRAGIILFLSQLCAAVCTGILFSCGRKRMPPSVHRPSPSVQRGGLVRAVTDSVVPMLTVCAFVAFFAVINECVLSFFSALGMPDGARWFVSGILDLTEGIRSLADASGDAALLRASFLVGWSGICVHMQSASFLSGAGLRMKLYFLQKALCGLLCPLFTLCFVKIFC